MCIRDRHKPYFNLTLDSLYFTKFEKLFKRSDPFFVQLYVAICFLVNRPEHTILNPKKFLFFILFDKSFKKMCIRDSKNYY